MTNKAVVTGGTDAAMNFGTWDGTSAIPFTLNGQTQSLKNQVMHTIYIPLVVRH